MVKLYHNIYMVSIKYLKKLLTTRRFTAIIGLNPIKETDMIRNTVQRTVVLKTVLEMKNHPTADEVYAEVLPKCPGISRATVYRVLGNLSKEGAIRRVEIPNGPDRFDFTTCEHAHFVCDICGKVYDFPIKLPEKADFDNYSVSGIEVTARGICPECRKTK